MATSLARSWCACAEVRVIAAWSTSIDMNQKLVLKSRRSSVNVRLVRADQKGMHGNKPDVLSSRCMSSVNSQDAAFRNLSRRSLNLAKAKLKQASNISALLAGFGMVRIYTGCRVEAWYLVSGVSEAILKCVCGGA